MCSSFWNRKLMIPVASRLRLDKICLGENEEYLSRA